VTARSFTSLLVRGVILLNIFVAAMVGLTLYQSRAEADARAEVSTATLAQVVEQNIADAINKIDLALRTTSDEIRRQAESGGMRTDGLDSYLAKLTARLPEVQGVRITDTEGVVQYGYGGSDNAHVSLADRPFFQAQRGRPDAGLVFSDPLLGRVSHEWVLVETRRYTLPDPAGEARFGGIIYGDLSIDRLANLFAGLDVGPHGSVTLWGSALKIVVRYPEPSRSAAGPSACKSPPTS
jgi:two-component system, cell cycle sensor histidine kinase and response regulator CckA